MSESNPLILVVDDDVELLEAVQSILTADNYRVLTANSCPVGIEMAWAKLPDLIIVDIHLPEMSGFEFCQTLKKEPWFQGIPIVILSAANSVVDKVEGFEAGAVDFISKPFQARELSARIRAHLRNKFWNESLGAGSSTFQSHLREIEGRFLALAENSDDLIFELDACGRYAYLGPNCQRVIGYDPVRMVGTQCSEFVHPDDKQKFFAQFEETIHAFKTCQILFRLRRSDDQWRWMECTWVAFYTADHERRLICVARDITERKKLDDQLAFLASHDPLTQLHNRQYLLQRLKSVVNASNDHALNAVLYIDLDNFKIVNDNHGHMVGDRILREFAERLKDVFGAKAVLSRFGGDEFVILLEHTTREETTGLAEKLRQAVEGFHFHESTHVFELNASIGIAFTDTASGAKDTLKRADDACYIAKMRGRNRVEIYSPDSSEINRLRHDTKWSALVKSALKQERFELWYQPIVDVVSGEVDRYEALLRLRAEDGAIILPGEFLAAAARWGMMIQLDRYVIGLGVQDLSRHPKLKLSINLSAESMVEPSLPEFIEDTFARACVTPDRVIFEITETEVIANFTRAMDVLKRLRSSGFLFALDDFGVGFSSMAYLRDLPVDRLKIDGIFIRSIMTEPYNHMLAKSINEIGHFLGMKTVAEFVENAEVLEVLREIGTDYAQGNYFGEAKPITALCIGNTPIYKTQDAETRLRS